ncbi:MAG: hypothetical protein ACODAA_09240 [Gemmatimonadota bacterium]
MRRPVPSLCTFVLVACVACDDAGFRSPSYYEERIAPVLETSCARQTAGCHLDDGSGRAAGNLDLASYDALMRRRDVLPACGPYPIGQLLMKVSGPQEVRVQTLDPPDASNPDARHVTVTTDIRHNAGAGIELSSSAFAQLRRWIESGYTRSGVPRTEAVDDGGSCVSGVGSAPGFDPDAEPPDGASFDRFVSEVQPVLRERCAGSGCHGARLADLYLACGDDEPERRWNHFIATQHLDDPVEESELLQRPLAASRGGAFHGGGDTFADVDDPGYEAIRSWAAELVSRSPEIVRPADPSEGFRFFANRVQPVLVRKGCTFLNCHSPISLKMNLRGGSQGSFSRFALERNYALARKLLALESPDPSDSRIIAKNLYSPDAVEGGRGMAHRGGALLEDFGGGEDGSVPASPELCGAFDPDDGNLDETPAYCVLARWHAIERGEAVDRGDLLPDAAPVRALVWVARPPGLGGPDDFDAYRPGADLRMAEPTFDAGGRLEVGPSSSLLPACGLDPGLGSRELEAVAAVLDPHVEPLLDQPQMLVELTGQIRKPPMIVRDEQQLRALLGCRRLRQWISRPSRARADPAASSARLR